MSKQITIPEHIRLKVGIVSNMFFKEQDLSFQLVNDDEVAKHIGIVVQETFVDKVYNKYPIKDQIVVDIGAFYGDTAINFLREGAKMVYSYEPYVSCFFINSNVLFNRCDYKKIKVHNAPILEVHKKVQYENNKVNTGAHSWPDEGIGQETESLTLADIVKEITNDHGYITETSNMILKMDCEGVEHNIFETVDIATITKFKYVMMEVHQSHYADIASKLIEFGFSIDSVNEEFETTFMLYAHRVD